MNTPEATTPVPARDGAPSKEPPISEPARVEDEKRALRPRPEAKRMRWRDLCVPERRAVRALLLRLFAALDDLDASSARLPSYDASGRAAALVDADCAQGSQLATGFLISGPRGTGKTTVLLNAVQATEHPCRFFGIPSNDLETTELHEETKKHEKQEAIELREETKKHLRRLVWLDPLDMALLPEKTNLLTTLLVRVRNALDRKACDDVGSRRDAPDRAGAARDARDESVRARRYRTVPPTLLGEGEDLVQAWQTLDDLVNRATLMWEGVPEAGDARKRVEPQIEAAETYADLQSSLRGALDDATYELGHRLGNVDNSTVLILPIDNADRNGKYAFELLKLIRMVYCPRLWFVLTGSRDDLNTFLSAQMRTSLGSPSAHGEDSIEEIARRRATAMLLTAVPLAHQVDVTRMEPYEVMTFRPEDDGRPSDTLWALLNDKMFSVAFPGCARQPTLRDLMVLAGHKVDGKPEEKVGDSGSPDKVVQWYEEHAFLSYYTHRHLAHSIHFDHDDKFESQWFKKDRLWFSHAAMQALNLPVRRFLDLLQASRRWRVQTVPGRTERRQDWEERQERAIELVHEMLSSAIVESDLSDWAVRLLLGRVIYRGESGLICLDLRGNPLEWKTRLSDRDIIELRKPEGGEWLSSQLVVHDYYGFAMRVSDGKRTANLEPAIAGWMMLLYDLLQSNAGPRVIMDTEKRLFKENPALVETRHSVVVTEERVTTLTRSWTMPYFDRFFDFDVMALSWQAFLQHALPVVEAPGSGRAIENVEFLMQLMIAAWTDCATTTCALTASKEVVERLSPDWRRFFWKTFEGTNILSPNAQDAMALNKYRESVDGALAGLYASTRRGAAQDVSYRWLQIHAWMEQGAKLLQMPEYMGTVPPQAGGKSLLSDFWREHANLLTWKRYEKTREAMVEAMRREAGGEETKPSTDATRSMCQRWFRAVKDAVKDAAISTLDLDPLTAGPKLESPAPPPPTPRAAPGCGEAGSSAR